MQKKIFDFGCRIGEIGQVEGARIQGVGSWEGLGWAKSGSNGLYW